MKYWITLAERKNSKRRKNHVGWKFDLEQIFYSTFLGSSNTVFMLNWFIPCFIQHFNLMKSFRNVSFGRVNGSHLSVDLPIPRDQSVIRLYGLKVVHHLSKFGGEAHFGTVVVET